MDEGRHAVERMERQIIGRRIGRERVHLDLIVGHPLLGQGQAGHAGIDAGAVAVENEGSWAILAFR